MNYIEKYKEQRKRTARLFGSKCFLCEKKFGKNFHFHHIAYRKTEKKHSDFGNWMRYTMYIIPIIEQDPGRFALLCHTCHHLVTILQKIKDNDRFERVVDLARRSRK